MTPERQTLIERIRAMQAKAENEASTEAEAMQAAAMAARLMSKHEVTDEELSIIEAGGYGIQMQRVNHGTKRMHFSLKYAAHGIEVLTETRGYVGTNWSDEQRLVFTGLDSDVEMAIYLSLVIKGAADRAWKAHATGRIFSNRTRSRKSFLIGFGWRIKERLIELAQERKEARSTSGTALVVRKDALIEAHLAEQEVDIKSSRSRKTTIDGNYDHGASAANDLNLSRPLGDDRTSEPMRLEAST
ncbi:DUF2786 domain-containing protein [uncultured Sulfitobacter sp.]|uniref:DUF7168 domain-containing protein n=1 Tax=uncultured Sulfitobacter sp. TaxID=191468 RepID=UPI0030FC7679